MARTIRRKSKKAPRFVTHDLVEKYGHLYIRQEKEPKEKAKALARWHSDSNYKTGIHNQRNDPLHRAEAKAEIMKWIKNPEHEVQIRRKRYFVWD